MSAVSTKVIPSASAASTTTRVPSRSRRRPKLLQPSPTRETRRPLLPSSCSRIESILTDHYTHPRVRDLRDRLLERARRAPRGGARRARPPGAGGGGPDGGGAGGPPGRAAGDHRPGGGPPADRE